MSAALTASEFSDDLLSCKLMVFSIAGHYLALPALAIQRVAIAPPLISLNPQGINLLHLKGHELAVVDLAPHLNAAKRLNSNEPSIQASQPFPDSHPDSQAFPEPRQFIVIAQSQQGTEIGFLADQLPTILDVPHSEIRPFPPEYRQTTPLGIARYIVTHTTDSEQQTIFVLELATNPW